MTPVDNDHDVVQLYISDAARDEEATTFVLTIHAKIRALQTPALAQLQRAAMTEAQDGALSPLLQKLARELQTHGLGTQVPYKNPR